MWGPHLVVNQLLCKLLSQVVVHSYQINNIIEFFYLFTDCDLDAFRDIKPFQLPKSKDCDRYSDLPTNGFLNWAACSQPPRYAEMPPPLQRILPSITEEVVFFNVQKCYEKVQCRKNKKSKQRVQGATINLRVATDAPISKVEVYVERLPKAAVLCGDSNGRVPLKLKMENLMYSDVCISFVMIQHTCTMCARCEISEYVIT